MTRVSWKEGSSHAYRRERRSQAAPGAHGKPSLAFFSLLALVITRENEPFEHTSQLVLRRRSSPAPCRKLPRPHSYRVPRSMREKSVAAAAAVTSGQLLYRLSSPRGSVCEPLLAWRLSNSTSAPYSLLVHLWHPHPPAPPLQLHRIAQMQRAPALVR